MTAKMEIHHKDTKSTKNAQRVEFMKKFLCESFVAFVSLW